MARHCVAKGIAVDIRRNYLTVNGHIFIGNQTQVVAHRRIVNRVDADSDGAGSSAAIAIANGDDKTVAAVVVLVRGVYEPAGHRIKHHRAVRGLAGYHITERIVFNILRNHLPVYRHVFIGGEGDVIGGGRIVYRRDIERNAGSTGVATAIGHGYDKTIRAVVIGIWCKGKLASKRIELQHTISWRRGEREGQGIVFDVSGDDLAGHWLIFVKSDGLIGHQRRPIDVISVEYYRGLARCGG